MKPCGLTASNQPGRLLILWKGDGGVKQSGAATANSPVSLDSVLGHLPRDRVAVQAEQFGGVADVSFRPLQRPRDEHLLELAARLVVQHTLLEQFLNQLLQLIAHDQRSSRPDNRRKASMYFSRVRAMTSSGSEGTGGCLFQRISSR